MAKATSKVKKTTKKSPSSKQALKTQTESLSQSSKSPIVVQKAFNRSDLIKTLSEHAAISKKEAVAVLDTLKDIIVAHLVKGGPQQFKWPGLLNMHIKEKPATQAKQGINPFTGEATTFAAKPAKSLIKMKALNNLRDLVEGKV